MLYLIWSNEHQAWWRPNSAGYTTNIREAGDYDRLDAINICATARGGWLEHGLPTDLPIPKDDTTECAERLAHLRGAHSLFPECQGTD